MKKNFKVNCNKIASLLLSLILTAGLFTGCGAEQETAEVDENLPGWQRYAGEEVTLDWYVNYSWFVTKWGGNVVSDKITEETGVTVNFVTPIGNEEEKLNSLISLDALPDIITLGWWAWCTR